MSLLPELQDILRLLDRFVGHYPIYLYLVDSSNRLIWFNSHMAEQLPQFHIGQQLDCQNSLWPCDEKCQHCQENKPGLTSKIERHLIHQSPGSGSKERYLEFISLPIYQTPNKIEGVLRLGIDVTENERLQAKLREKEKLFSAIINTSTDAIIFLDKDDIIRSWNKGAEEIFGYSEAEMIGKPIQKLIPHELIEMDELSYFHRELKEKGVIKKYETQRLHKSGRPIYVDISCTSIFDEKGNFVGTSEIMKDIDARKELEFELLRTILELSKLNELNEILYSTYDEREIFRIILIAITAGEGLRFNRAFLLLLNDEKTLKGDLAIGPSDEEEASRIWSELNKDYHYLSDIVRIYNIDLEGADKKVNEIVHQIEIPLEEEENICVQSLLHKKVVQVKNGQLLQGETGSFNVKDTNLLKLLKNDSFVIVPLFTKKELLGVIIADNCIN
ncbi:MAG: PAS domain S-box protein, partial [Calditrichaeota bacterium]